MHRRHLNRKRSRLIEKLRAMGPTEMLAIHPAPKGSSNPADPHFDPTALYLSRQVLLLLIEEDDDIDSDDGLSEGSRP